MRNSPRNKENNTKESSLFSKDASPPQHSSSLKLSRFQAFAALTTLAFCIVWVRLYALTSDAYPRLSWSSALLTDEGFYLHNARNILLFHTFQTDQFNNALIMPFLHYAQLATFHLLGFGLLQDRLLSVASSLLTLPFLFLATKRIANTQTALLACLLWGLSHANFLYNRLALMDTPGALVLCVGWWLWGEAWAHTGKKRKGLLALCGVVLCLVYGVRGLGALVWVVPVGILGWEWWKKREKSTPQELLWYLGGLGAFLVLYFFWWVRPHYQQLQHMNHYYVRHQVLPRSLNALRLNILVNLFGHTRGLLPYLFLHLPFESVLVTLLWVASRFPKRSSTENIASNSKSFLWGWLLLLLLFCITSSYAPSRYYVLFYPPLAALAALGLMRASQGLALLLRSRRLCSTAIGYLSFLALRQMNLPGRMEDYLPTAIGFLIGLLAFTFYPPFFLHTTMENMPWLRAAFLIAWALLNIGWTVDWLTHISYTQRAISLELTHRLPANSVLLGDAAPGVCLFNKFLSIPVIPGLCNDQAPLSLYPNRPHYLALLNGKKNLSWWRRRYPYIFQSPPILLKKVVGFNVVVYTAH